MLGDGYARAKPQVVSAVMISASLDWAAMTIAAALVAEEEAAPHNGSGIVRATTVMRPLSGRLLVGVTFDPSRGYARRGRRSAWAGCGARLRRCCCPTQPVRAPSHRHQFPPFGLTKQTIFSS